MASLPERTRAFFRPAGVKLAGSWRWYRARPRWQQLGIAALALLAFVGIIALARGGDETVATPQGRTVTLASIEELSGVASGIETIGNVRSREEAPLVAQAGGVVRRVNASLGQAVSAGSVVLEVENDTERAAVAQAEAQVEGALAARTTASLQAEGADIRTSGSRISLANAEQEARDAYISVFTALDATLENEIDVFFGGPTAVGPAFLINPGTEDRQDISRARGRIGDRIETYGESIPGADSRSARSLIDESENVTRDLQAFATRLAAIAHRNGSEATPAQLAALASARANLNQLVSRIASIEAALDAASIARLSTTQDARVLDSGINSASAQVEATRAGLAAARAGLERTVVRAPISGQMNAFDIGVGDYVAPGQQIGLIAQNGALEVVAHVSEKDRARITAGSTVTIEGGSAGVITAIAPAIDPVTRRVEVRVGVTQSNGLLNGGVVRLSFPAVSEFSDGPLLLPLAAVKLRQGDRAVFSIGDDGRLIAHPVQVGDVRGERIEVLTDLNPSLRIVSDARGLVEGEIVQVAP